MSCRNIYVFFCYFVWRCKFIELIQNLIRLRASGQAEVDRVESSRGGPCSLTALSGALPINNRWGGGGQGQGPWVAQFIESDSAFESECESKSETETESESESELSWQTAGGNSQAKDCVFGIGIYARAR